MKMPTLGGIFIFVSRDNFMLSWAEHEKKFYNLGDWTRSLATVQPQIRRRTTRSLFRVCTICRKTMVKWNSLKFPFRTIFPAYTQSTHQCYNCFSLLSFNDCCFIMIMPYIKKLRTSETYRKPASLFWKISSHLLLWEKYNNCWNCQNILHPMNRIKLLTTKCVALIHFSLNEFPNIIHMHIGRIEFQF